MSSKYVLDACALIAYLNAEPGGGKVRDLLEDESNTLLLHHINLGEVYYEYHREEGSQRAGEVLDELLGLRIDFVEDLSLDTIKLAGKYKAENRVSYADAFALAPANRHGARIVTTDHHEFDLIESRGLAEFYWLR